VQLPSQGLFQSERYNDVLSALIETPKHSGKLRGHSDFTTPSVIFGKNPRRMTSHSDCITHSRVFL
jgi:hypothetical protein